MFMPTGGGGKGNRPQSTHQQQNNHQTQHQHSHPPHHHHQQQQQQNPQQQQQSQVQSPQQQQQQSRISLLQQQQQDQQQQPQAVIVPQPSSVSALNTLAGIHHHHHSTQQQQAQQQQQQQQQQLQQQHHLQQQPIIFYATQPPPQLPAAYASHAQQQQQQQHSSSSSSNGSNGGAALQLSGAASNATLGHAGPHGHAHAHHHHAAPPPHGPHGPHAHAHANGVLTPATSNTNLVRALSNSTLPPHFTPSAGLIAPGAGANGGQGSTTFMTAAFLPFNHPGQLIGAPSMGFPANGAAAAPAAGFYAAAPPPQKQQLAAGQQPGGGAQPTITYYHGTLPPTAAQLSANNGNANVSGSNPNSGSQRGSMRGGQRSTPPQQPSYFAPYGAAAPPPRPQLVNNAAAAAVTPILNTRNNAINGGAAFHLPPAYCPLGPPPNLTAAPQLMAAPTGGGPTGLHTYAPHLQSSSATAVGVGVGVGAVPGVTSSFSSTSLNTGQQLLAGGGGGVADKVKERRHAIPIIHPVTQEDIMDPKSSVFNKKDSNCTLTSSSTGSDASIGHKSSQEVAIKVDHQMQTEVASKSAIVFSGQAAASTTLPLTDEDKVSVIVKDILANSGNPDEHLSFLQFNDVDNTSEHTPESSGGGSMDNYYNENAAGNSMKPAAHFQESQKSKMQQRPKSANKQSTATPTSIATAVAEAVAGVGILGDIQRATMHHQQQQQSAKSSTAELCPVSPSKGQKQQQQQKPIVQKQTQQQQQQQQQHQLQSHSQQPSTSSSSTASTPTHQPRLQPQMRATIGGIKAGAAATPSAVAATDMAAGATNTLSKKNQRKAQKRKELEKKKQKTTGPPTTTASSMSTASGSSSSTLTASSSSNMNAKTNAKGSSNTATTGAAATSGAETSLIFVTTTKTTSGVAIAMPTTTDKLSATSNNSSLSFSLRDKQQPKEQQQPHDTELNFDSKEEKKHLANEEIVAKFLLKSCDDEQPSLVEPQLEFLNSSSSVCEEDSSNTSEKCIEKESSQTEEHNVDELKFGDFSEEVPTHHSSFICSSTWSSSQPPAEAPKSVDNVDCAPKRHSVTELPNSNISSKKSSPVHQAEKQEKVTQPKVSKVAAKSATAATPKFIRYNIEQLRELSKLSDSRKPPLVPCQKGDCIAQLFVSRQSQQQQQHHHGHNQHGQQYQQHTHDAMDYMSGKRGRGHGGHGLNKKHHDNYQSMGGGNASGNSASGGGGMGGQSNQRYMDIIRVQLSLKEEIKLSECENAWQPETLRRMSMFSAPTAAAATEADKENELEAVLKKVRGILNKLTPDNFEVLLKEMSSIKMDTQSKMTNVMLLIFEKTISEPNFAPTYARFCKVLFHEIKAENKSLFTSSLITRIQHEFESNVNDANAKAKKLQPTQDRINACSDATKKAELRAEMEDLEYQFRRRAWGTVRFIGELFKLQSLTSDRVLHCVESLLEHGCEEKLEYMCKLLTTVGHLLEAGSSEQYQSGGRIEKIFRRIQDIVQRSRGNNSSYRQHQQNIKISSRVRFMMQDVLDLRARNWDQPAGATHTTGGSRQQQQQRHKQLDEPKAQQQQQQRGGHQQQQGGYQYQQQQQKQQHHHHGHDGGGNYFLQKLNKSHQQENQSLSIDPTKLRFSSSNNDDVTAKLGNSSHYQWRNVGNRPVSAAAVTTQPSLLKRMPSASSTNTFSYPPYQQQSQTPPAVATPILSRSNSSTNNNNAENSPSEVSFDDKQCQEVITKLVDEVVSTRGWQNEVLSIWRSLVAKQPEAEAVILYVLMDYVHRGTVKRQQRLACANAFGYLMDQQALDMATFNQAYNRFGEGFPDLLVDVPNGWTYVFEFLGPIMHDGHLELKDVWQRRWLDDSKCTLFFVRSFVSYFVQEFGAGYAHKLWHVDNQLDRGQMFWSDARKFRDFLQANSFQFLEPNGTGTAAGLQQRSKVTRTPGEHVERISYLLSLSSDTAIDYINTNVHINANFVRQLTKFLCCDFALTNNNNNNNNKGGVTPQLQLNVETFRMQCTPLLRLCIDAQEAHEVACIDETVESLREHHLVEIEDELAAGEAICSALGVLYDCEVISRDSFDKWIKREIEKPANWSRPLMTKLRALIEEM
ncbi:AF4/FMR2 family member lilli [Drosophila nasuta]|uniref:AF4/FMR2 family member lilli n=1 Tax=Drosophila nasuta TaxID=42062 RepID=UPI00295E293B|nr:AF4/FMR2 family member lilli [Drosophila nasuta]